MLTTNLEQYGPREMMEYDVVIVGGGPAGLSAAIRRKHLTAENGNTVSVCILEKDGELGAHILSGAVMDPQAIPQTNEFVMIVRRCVADLVHAGEPELEHVARKFNITSRTLRRRLKGSGTSFRALLEDIRQDMAKQYLLDTSLKMSDVAQLLGYSEQSAFNRAFLRWTGFSPTRYLRQSQR